MVSFSSRASSRRPHSFLRKSLHLPRLLAWILPILYQRKAAFSDSRGTRIFRTSRPHNSSLCMYIHPRAGSVPRVVLSGASVKNRKRAPETSYTKLHEKLPGRRRRVDLLEGFDWILEEKEKKEVQKVQAKESKRDGRDRWCMRKKKEKSRKRVSAWVGTRDNRRESSCCESIRGAFSSCGKFCFSFLLSFFSFVTSASFTFFRFFASTLLSIGSRSSCSFSSFLASSSFLFSSSLIFRTTVAGIKLSVSLLCLFGIFCPVQLSSLVQLVSFIHSLCFLSFFLSLQP